MPTIEHKVLRQFLASSSTWEERQDQTPDAEEKAADLTSILKRGHDDFDLLEKAYSTAKALYEDLGTAVSCETASDFDANLNAASTKTGDLAEMLKAAKQGLKKELQEDPDFDLPAAKEVIEEALDALKDLRRDMRELIEK